MRAIRLCILACLLAMLANVVNAYAAQASAREVETKWPNCSQIQQGRLGALHDWNGQIVSTQFQNLAFGAWTITYSPCIPTYLTIANSSNTYTFDAWIPSGTTTPTTVVNQNTRVITFTMPTSTGQVPVITAAYANSGTQQQIAVTVTCSPYVNTSVTNFTNPATGAWALNMVSLEACARFPYTNQGLPNGGIAALVIFLVLFALEMAACAGFHYNKKDTQPVLDGEHTEPTEQK